MQRYDITVKWRPGKELLLADALSRAFIQTENVDLEKEISSQICTINNLQKDIDSHVKMVENSLPITLDKKEQFKRETENDEELRLLKKYITEGWPESKSNLPGNIKQCYNYASELTIMDDLIFKSAKILVPKSLRKEMLKIVHYNHLGIEKYKNRAREVLFWPGMCKEIEDLVQNCVPCLKYRRANSKETLINREVPEGPWQTLLIYFSIKI